MSQDYSPPQGTRTRLNGWKEIAAYLGKGVRTVQRWEHMYDMPVHRVGHDGGEIVFAFREELDAWAAQGRRERIPHAVDAAEPNTRMPAKQAGTSPSDHAVAGAAPDATASDATELATVPRESALTAACTDHSRGTAAASVDPPGGPSDAGQQADANPDPVGARDARAHRGAPLRAAGASIGTRGPLVYWMVGSLVMVSLGVVVGFVLAQLPWHGPPASARVTGNVLEVFALDGAALWHYAFRTEQGENSEAVRVVDLDGDGSPEVVAMDTSLSTKEDRVVRVFESDGRLRFEYRPVGTVQFGDETYSAPWLAWRFFVTTEPDGSVGLWTVVTHGLLFPTRLDRLDRHGKVQATYWSNGYIDFVGRAKLHGRDVLLVGGIANEFMAGSLAILTGPVTGSAPAENPKYRCVSCPPGSPAHFFIFPRGCVGQQLRASATTSYALVEDDGSLVAAAWATLEPTPATRTNRFGGNFLFGPDLRPRRVEVTSGAMNLHDALARAGLLDHRFGPLDHRELSVMRYWNGRSFAEFPPVPVVDDSRPVEARASR